MANANENCQPAAISFCHAAVACLLKYFAIGQKVINSQINTQMPAAEAERRIVMLRLHSIADITTIAWQALPWQ